MFGVRCGTVLKKNMDKQCVDPNTPQCVPATRPHALTEIYGTVCAPASLGASTRVSPDVGLHKLRSPSFKS